jgi:predicted nuclease of predicted toxin-antitoxin system
MKFKIDENVPVEAAELLRQSGYDVLTVIEQELGGETDETVARICQREKRALVTFDTGFADIRAYPPHAFPGMIVFRLKKQSSVYILEVLERLMDTILSEPVEGHLWIVEEDRIRIRG